MSQSPKDLPPPPYDDPQGSTSADAINGGGHLILGHGPESPLPGLTVPTEVPNASQALCHLKLLNAFAKLRAEISSTDGLFGIRDCCDTTSSSTPSDGASSRQTILQDEIREKRWAVYVARAADRFESWWQAKRKELDAQHVTFADLKAPGFELKPMRKVSFDSEWMKGALPPLDVLMVWHSFMLNPRAFLEDCLRQGAMPLWYHGMPWAVLDAAIDGNSGKYHAGEQSMAYWTSKTGRPWTNLDESPLKTISCPRCQMYRRSSSVNVEWTTTGPLFEALAAELQYDKVQDSDDKWREHCHKATKGKGFADAGLRQSCPRCDSKVDHEHLRAGAFFQDALALRPSPSQKWTLSAGSDSLCPLPGTLIDHRGNATRIKSSTSRGTCESLFANRLVEAMITDGPWTPTNIEHMAKCGMEDIRKDIQDALKDSKLINHSIHGLLPWGKLSKRERISIRRMMACYWDNSSPFAIDLVAAVIRQGSFIEKMQGIDWLHSPARTATMDRLLVKYQRFFNIMGAHPDQMAVPTLDVDLAWHTHQLSPTSYYKYSRKLCNGVFIDHDDKIPEVKLSNSFAQTSKIYQELYGEPYSQCTCWYCEATRVTHTTTSTRLFHRSTVKHVEAELYDPSNAENDGVHISAHNSIRPHVLGGYDRHVLMHELELRKAYEKACKRATKQGRDPPQLPLELTGKNGYRSLSGAVAGGYAYSMVLPFGAPICVDSAAYVCNPSCANAVAGQAGNCAAGSCGGLVAAGSCGSGGLSGLCAGAGSSCAGGACAGGAQGMGSCGGGGIGGFGGCGGGGGGGCGGGGGGCGGGG